MTNLGDAARSPTSLTSPEFFQLALDRSQDAVTILQSIRDQSGAIVDFVWVYVNHQATVVLQRSAAELVGQRLLTVLPGNRTGGLFERYRQVVESGAAQDGEIAYAADGINGWFRNMTVRLGDGVAIFFRDITAEKQTAEALRISEERRRLAVAAAGLGDWYFDLAGGNLELSTQCKAHFGLHPDDPATLNDLMARIHPEDRRQAEVQLKSILRQGREFETTQRVLWPDGSLHWIAIRGRALPDRPNELVGVTLDVTEQVWAEQSQRLLAETGRLLAETHDFSATLNTVVRLPIPDLADYAVIYLNGPAGVMQRTVQAHRDPDGAQLLAELETSYPFDPAGPSPVAQVLRGEHDILRAQLSTDQIDAMARNSQQHNLIQRLGTRGFMVVPLDIGGERIGALLLATTTSSRQYSPREEELAASLAERIALAITNARLYAEVQAGARRTEETLAQLDALVDDAPIGVAFLDRELRFARVNDRLAQINGISAEAHQGRHIRDVVPSLASIAEPLLQRVLTERTPILDIELVGATAATPDDLRIWHESFYPVQTRDGRMIGVGALINDITEQRRTEAALHLSEERLRLALSGAPIVLFSHDRELRYTWIYRPLPDRSTEEILGRRDDELMDPESAAEVMAVKRAVLESGRPLRREVTMRYHGATLFYDLIVEPLHDGEGQVSGVTCAAIDVTERRNAELERAKLFEAERQARASAELAARQRDELLAFIAHDLKNPLTAIFGTAQMLQRRLSNPANLDVERLRRNAHTMETAAATLNTQLTELQDVARLQAGQPLHLQRRQADLLELVKRAVTVRQAATDIHQFALDLPTQPLFCSCDPLRIERVINNLLSNAVKYSPDGGRITVRLGRETDLDGTWAMIEVGDEGIGITPEDLPHIFSHFYRGRNVSGVGGTGLGLASVAAIVAQHGGRIVAASKANHGTTMTVRLPL